MIEQRNLILAVVLSVAIVVAFDFLYRQPLLKESARQEVTETARGTATDAPATAKPPAPGASAPPTPGETVSAIAVAAANREEALAGSRRLPIRSARLHGSITLDGGRIDDVSLADYHATVDPGSPEIVLLSPAGAPKPYHADFGWVSAQGSDVELPGAETPWQTNAVALGPGSPVSMTWDNGAGLRFTRTFALDENYLFTITQKVENHGDEPVTLYPYGLVSRTDIPEVTGFYILHEGAYGVFNETLEEYDYDEMVDDGDVKHPSTGGWIGITDKYWLVALIPAQDEPFTGSFKHAAADGRDKFQVDFLRAAKELPAGGAVEVSNRLFVGAKEVHLLDSYEEKYRIARFDLAIDWGWFYFLTRPIFVVLDYFNGKLGNFGLAILLLTVLIKILFFPLANKSYSAMSRMKILQPQVAKLRERHGEDKERLNKEMMALYKKEKVNPMAGCLPIAIQIPVFFALYKVLFVTIEMRHAPFYGWIVDLSAADPTNIFNLFGLIPWTPPEIIPVIGIWPLLMGVSMFLQQKLNPQPPDPVQAKIFMLLPFFFTFLLAAFPAGLVVYWTWNNILSMSQQWVIMKRAGAFK